MAQNTFNNSLFPAANQPLITGGTFILNNTHVQSGPKCGYDRLLEAVAPSALHNSGHVFDPPKCHPGTRVVVIQAIIDWISQAHEATRDKSITWVTGAAGAGKSAIGRTVCERCSEEGSLLASFFFSSTDLTRNHWRSLVATIAYQMAAINPAIRQTVTNAIEQDPLIFTRSLRAQFLSLVINPLSSVFANDPFLAPTLIVIDGLDECHDRDSQRDILETLVFASNSSPIPIHFLLCSRPENHIVHFFSSPDVQEIVFKIYLGDEYSPDDDIKLYLSDSFTAIKRGHIFRSSIPDTWPSEDHIYQIVWKSSGQFIYSATVVRYVESSRHRPHQRLDAVLGIRPPFKDLPFAQLDTLYTHILLTAEDPSLITNILAFPAIYNEATTSMTERILSLEPGEVEVLLSDFGSIVKIYPEEERVVLLHKSFEDFLFDPQRSKDLYKNRTETIAVHILRVMEFFSGEHARCRHIPSYHTPAFLLYNVNEDWNSPTYSAVLDSIAQFPMESFCRSLFSHNVTKCDDVQFLWAFFLFLNKFRLYKSVNEAYDHHVHSFCKSVLAEIHSRNDDDWKSHYALTSLYLRRPYRQIYIFLPDNLVEVLESLSANSYFKGQVVFRISHTFGRLLTQEDKCSIFSRAAAYCLHCLCDNSPENRREAKKCIKIGPLRRKFRKSYPWRWHRRFWSSSQEARFVIKTNMERYFLSTFTKLQDSSDTILERPFLICPLFLIHQTHRRTQNDDGAPWTMLPFQYMCYLESLIDLLPHAGRYKPLIELCKTKRFSAMSMAFPVLSRRARGIMAKYLGRMGYKGDDEGEVSIENTHDGIES